jgi:polysaccharide biosynthesis protein PslH
MPSDLLDHVPKNVVIVGEVESAVNFMNSKAIMIVPLLSGGGIRVKIIEGLALGKAIISTSIGAEGINAISGTDILIADTPAEWGRAIERVLGNHHFIEKLGAEGRKLAQTNFDNREITGRLIEFYNELRGK